MKSALSTNLEYWALRSACALVNSLPYSVASALARALGSFAVRVLGFKRKRTLERIASVFPDKSRRECVAIAVESLQNVLVTSVEMMRAPRLGPAWIDRHVKDGRHYKGLLQALVDEGKGVVIMVPHCGNWYMAAWTMACYGLPLCALAARQRNRKIDAWMARNYGSIEILYRKEQGTLRMIANKLAEGRAFAILPDLRVSRPDVEVDFFGGKANVSRAGAEFALRAGAPIVVAAMRRENGQHCFELLEVLRPDGKTAAELTARAMSLLDGFIRRHPGQWYWYNKRWILQPVLKSNQGEKK